MAYSWPLDGGEIRGKGGEKEAGGDDEKQDSSMGCNLWGKYSDVLIGR